MKNEGCGIKWNVNGHLNQRHNLGLVVKGVDDHLEQAHLLNVAPDPGVGRPDVLSQYLPGLDLHSKEGLQVQAIYLVIIEIVFVFLNYRFSKSVAFKKFLYPHAGNRLQDLVVGVELVYRVVIVFNRQCNAGDFACSCILEVIELDLLV